MAPSAAAAPGQKSFPITAASCSSRFSAGGSASSRALMMPCTDSGTGSCRLARCSVSIWAYCSAYSGLPPAWASSAASCPGCSAEGPSSDSTSRAVSASDSGASDKVSALGLPPPQPGRRASSSASGIFEWHTL
ncbi:MAG TPA: hypothetical protein DHU96_15905 [Actinobacteria bacterium]|nr:hypothetical protein [Actinomycetota bacterium]